jgi:simple sugar transport system permease protein
MLVDVAGSVIAIIAGLLFGLLFMIIVAITSSDVGFDDAIMGFLTILIGGFNRGFESYGTMIYFAVPIILTGLSVAFAFRTGLFNIGATGQLTIGAFAAVYIGVEWGFLGDITPILHWLVALLGAMIAGGMLGAIPGFLKAYRNVNEVVSSIMLNYVAMYLNSLLIVKYIYNPDRAEAWSIESTAVTPTFNLDYLLPNSSVNGGILVAIVVVIVLHIILNKTTFGFELKAVGFNRSASKYAGMNEKRNIVYSMIISGAIAGLAGAMIFLVVGKNLKPVNVLLLEGFTGIAISLLGLSNPFGVLLAGLFYGSLQQGGFYLQAYPYTPEIVDIIIAVIIYASALGLFLQRYVLKAMRAKEMKAEVEDVPVVEGSDE